MGEIQTGILNTDVRKPTTIVIYMLKVPKRAAEALFKIVPDNADHHRARH